MLLQTDVTGLPVLVVGPLGLIDASVRRWQRAGAVVTTLTSKSAAVGHFAGRVDRPAHGSIDVDDGGVNAAGGVRSSCSSALPASG